MRTWKKKGRGNNFKGFIIFLFNPFVNSKTVHLYPQTIKNIICSIDTEKHLKNGVSYFQYRKLRTFQLNMKQHIRLRESVGFIYLFNGYLSTSVWIVKCPTLILNRPPLGTLGEIIEN
jgi:hypothetical protein